MIYIGALRVFWFPFALVSCIAIAAHLLSLRTTARCLNSALLGAGVGYVLTPLAGAQLGLVPDVMIEPQYFIHPYYGCIAPGPLGWACATEFLGVVLGFIAGAYVGFRRRTHA
jgi:hypothetical protein